MSRDFDPDNEEKEAAMPFDSVVSIGGQSLLDGVWRILQPALQSLNNPLPIALPGMSNAWVRIRKLTPALSSLPGPVPSNRVPALTLDVELELLGEVLLTASVKAGTINLALPTGNITFPPGQGTFTLPNTPIDITPLAMSGEIPVLGGTETVTLTPQGTKEMTLPSTPPGTLDLSPVTGRLSFDAGSLGDVGLPLPSVVPLSLNLTPAYSPRVTVSLPLPPDPIIINQASAFGLQLTLGPPTIDAVTPFSAPDIRTAIEDGLRRLLSQLGVDVPQPTYTLLPDRESLPGVGLTPTTRGAALPSDIREPFPGFGPTLAQINTTASRIATAAQAVVNDVLTNALKELRARTGRLIFPQPGVGATCDTALLPTAATAQVVLAAGTSSPILQVGFYRTGVSVAPFDFPNFTPSAAAEVEVRIGNLFLRDLLCCLIEKLPNFTFLSPARPNNNITRDCCTWDVVALELGPLTLHGVFALCIVGPAPTARKTIELSGTFEQENILFRAVVRLTLTLDLRLDGAAAVTGLRLLSVSVASDVKLQPRVWPFLIANVGLLGLLGFMVQDYLSQQLQAAVDTLFSRARFLTSPVAVPPGVFEAFGPFVPATLTIDDLVATGTLATPTVPWTLLPITPPSLPPAAPDA